MPFLTINGVTFAGAVGQQKRGMMKAGRRGRSFKGQLRSAEKFHRNTWDVTVPVRNPEEARAMAGMLNGLGHFFAFQDGLQASTGLNPLTGYQGDTGPGMRIMAQAWGLYGRGMLALPTANSGNALRYDVQFSDDEWTAIYFQRFDGYWLMVAGTSDGTTWVNSDDPDQVTDPLGERRDGYISSASSGFRITMIDGVAFIDTRADMPFPVSDFALLPYKMTSEMLKAVILPGAGKFGPCPVLNVSGDIVDGESTFAVAQDVTQRFIQRMQQSNGKWRNAARGLQFKLIMTDDAFVRGVA